MNTHDMIELPPLPKGDIAADTCPVMWVHSDAQIQAYARAAIAIALDRQGRGEPDYFTYVINGVHREISETLPPDDSYDAGTLEQLYLFAPQPAVPAQVQYVDDINVADIPAVSAEHATLNLQPSSSMQPVATAFFTEKGEVAFTGLFDRTLKALEAVKTTRMGISSGSIDLYAAPQPSEPVKVPSDAEDDIVDLLAEYADHDAEHGRMSFDKWMLRDAVSALLARYGKGTP